MTVLISMLSLDRMGFVSADFTMEIIIWPAPKVFVGSLCLFGAKPATLFSGSHAYDVSSPSDTGFSARS
jgi:hypothetical protein